LTERKRGLEDWINAALKLFGSQDPHLSEFLELDAARVDEEAKACPPPAPIIDVSISHREALAAIVADAGAQMLPVSALPGSVSKVRWKLLAHGEEEQFTFRDLGGAGGEYGEDDGEDHKEGGEGRPPINFAGGDDEALVVKLAR